MRRMRRSRMAFFFWTMLLAQAIHGCVPRPNVREWRPSSAATTSSADSRFNDINPTHWLPPQRNPPRRERGAPETIRPLSGLLQRGIPVYVPRHVAKQLEKEVKSATRVTATPLLNYHAFEPTRTGAETPRHESTERTTAREEGVGTGEGIVESWGKGFGSPRAKRSFAQLQAISS